VPGKADGMRGKGKGVVNAATAASALSSMQDNTVRVADAMQCLAELSEDRKQGRTTLLTEVAARRLVEVKLEAAEVERGEGRHKSKKARKTGCDA
jgi:hypothetical protein